MSYMTVIVIIIILPERICLHEKYSAKTVHQIFPSNQSGQVIQEPWFCYFASASVCCLFRNASIYSLAHHVELACSTSAVASWLTYAITSAQPTTFLTSNYPSVFIDVEMKVTLGACTYKDYV